MSHIPDGTMHAWLDGSASFESAAKEDAFYAHFEICEDCRARLKEARRLRETAQTILSESGPGTIVQPSFSELRARARVKVRHERAGDTDAEVAASVNRVARRGGSGSGGGRKRSRRVPLAWAASIVVALGAGWFGNRILQESPVQTSPQVAQSEVAQSDLSRFSDTDAPVGAAFEQEGFADESVGRDAKIENLRAQSEDQLRQFAAAPEDQVAGQEGLQEGEAVAQADRLEMRVDDAADAVAGNGVPAEQAPAVEELGIPAGAAADAVTADAAPVPAAAEPEVAALASRARAEAPANEEPPSCFALTADGWTPPFELPAVLVRPAGDIGSRDDASVWTTLADNSIRIAWRAGEHTLLITAREAAGALEGSAAAWLEFDAAPASRGPVRLSQTACP